MYKSKRRHKRVIETYKSKCFMYRRKLSLQKNRKHESVKEVKTKEIKEQKKLKNKRKWPDLEREWQNTWSVPETCDSVAGTLHLKRKGVNHEQRDDHRPGFWRPV